MRFILVAIVAFSSFSLHAYNNNRCKSLFINSRKNFEKGNYIDYLTGQLGVTTSDSTTNRGMSTTSYVSSTGKCRAFGMAEKERIFYVAKTQNELQMEVAEGKGDYLNSLATLYGCNEKGSSHFGKEMKAKHSIIFGDQGPFLNPVDLTERMTDTVLESEILKRNCNIALI